MARKNFNKKLKSIIALTAVAALSIGNVASMAVTAFPYSPKAIEAKATTTLRNVMYYGDWSIWGGEGNFYPQDIPVENLTHLNLAFIDVDANGNLVFCDKDACIGHPLGHKGEITYGDINGGIVNELQVLRQKNPNLKIGLSIGGWSKSGNFSLVARDASKRAHMVDEICKFLKYSNFDFVDFDWEYPGSVRQPDHVDNKNDVGTIHSIPEDKENYIKLLEDVRAGLTKLQGETKKYYEMSVALPMAHDRVDLGIDVKRMFEILDFGNVMTYDAAGAWEGFSGHQTALYDNPNSPYAGKGFSVDSSIKNYIKLGAPSEKLVIGAAYYTRGWEQVANDVPDPSLPGLYGTATKVNKDADFNLSYGAKNDKPCAIGDGGRHAGNWAWRNQGLLKQAYPDLKEYWDDTAKAPYLYAENGAFFTYDNPRSIKEKVKYVHENNLGGMIAWMASNDAPTTSSKRDELTNITKEALFGKGPLPTYEVKEPIVDVKADLKTSKPAWGEGGGLNVTLTNNAKLDGAGGMAVKLTEEACKTLKYITVYIKTNGVAITGGEYPTPTPVYEDGYYVLRFDSYDAKLIKPGQTFSLKLTTDTVLENLDDIVSIEVSQKMYKSAPEFGRTVVWGEKVKPEYDKEDVNKDGVVNATDLSLVASKYNVKSSEVSYVEAYDINKDKIIDLYDLVAVGKKMNAKQVKPEQPEQPEKPEQPEQPEQPENPSGNAWADGVNYKAGDVVTYNGKSYKCIYAHTSHNGWLPGSVSTLWQEI